MRIPRKSGEAVIVLGGRNGAFTFGFWVTAGAVSSLGAMLLGHAAINWALPGLLGWWGA